MDSAALLAAARKVLDAVFEDGRQRGLNEASTRKYVIAPILSALGYDTFDRLSPEVYLSGAGESVDYVLTAGERRIFVEAKALSASLGRKRPSNSSDTAPTRPSAGRCSPMASSGTPSIPMSAAIGKRSGSRGSTSPPPTAMAASQTPSARWPLFAHDTLAGGDADLSAWSRDERARACLDRLLGNPTSSAVKAIVSSMRNEGISIRPSEVVDLLRTRGAAPAAPPAPSRHVAEQPASYDAPAPAPPAAAAPPLRRPTRRRRRAEPDTGVNFYLFPAGEHDGFAGLDHLKAWLNSGMWGLWPSTPFRRAVKPGDQCCFYATGVGIVATAEITATADQEVPPESWPGPTAWSSDVYALPIRDLQWLAQPIEITPELRSRMDTYQGKDLSRPWSWLVQGTSRLTEHDFHILTGRA